ncbi:MAG: alpha-ketoglutarate-dependent dioxygenase AlkB [Polyangiaceae bacterium]
MHLSLDSGAWIDLHERWLDPDGERALSELLLRELAWEQRRIVIFGKHILQPRLIAWAGVLPYRYSGQTLEARPWPELARAVLEPLCRAVVERSSVEFNHVLVNRYRDGNDSMGYHADDEPELGPDPVVASLSLGEPRRFALKRHKSAERARTLELGRGSLLIMGGTCQRHYRHAILREPSVAGERVSLTFRRLLGPPRAAAVRGSA